MLIHADRHVDGRTDDRQDHDADDDDDDSHVRPPQQDDDVVDPHREAEDCFVLAWHHVDVRIHHTRYCRRDCHTAAAGVAFPCFCRDPHHVMVLGDQEDGCRDCNAAGDPPAVGDDPPRPHACENVPDDGAVRPVPAVSVVRRMVCAHRAG